MHTLSRGCGRLADIRTRVPAACSRHVVSCALEATWSFCVPPDGSPGPFCLFVPSLSRNASSTFARRRFAATPAALGGWGSGTTPERKFVGASSKPSKVFGASELHESRQLGGPCMLLVLEVGADDMAGLDCSLRCRKLEDFRLCFGGGGTLCASLWLGLVDLEETSTNATIGHGQEGAAEGASALLVIGYMYASNSEDKDSMLRHAERANTTWGQGQHSCPCADLELLRHRAGASSNLSRCDGTGAWRPVQGRCHSPAQQLRANLSLLAAAQPRRQSCHPRSPPSQLCTCCAMTGTDIQHMIIPALEAIGAWKSLPSDAQHGGRCGGENLSEAQGHILLGLLLGYADADTCNLMTDQYRVRRLAAGVHWRDCVFGECTCRVPDIALWISDCVAMEGRYPLRDAEAQHASLDYKTVFAQDLQVSVLSCAHSRLKSISSEINLV
eukprot:1942873-Rhodomonas_salina.1